MRNLIKIFILLILSSCSNDYSINSSKHEVIRVKYAVDSNIIKIISPYKNKLDKEMNEVICYTKNNLIKGQPESTLGNFICDLSLEKTNGEANICVFNNGGLRDIIPKGDITTRDIYKVMPFENELVILELNNSEYYNLLQYITERGGEPFGGTNIIEKKDTIISDLNNKEKIRVLTSDYLANGGDNMSFFINKKQKKLGIKLRDAIIEYCQNIDTLDVKLDNRYIIKNDK